MKISTTKMRLILLTIFCVAKLGAHHLNELTVYNSKNVSVSGFSFSESQLPIKILGTKTENIQFEKNNFSNAKKELKQGSKVSKNAVKFKNK